MEQEPVLAPVQQVSVRKGTDEVVSNRSVVKGYEYDKDRYIVVEPEELKSIAPKIATEMEIQEFVQLSEIDPVYFETSYYVRPEEAGEKAYALLYRALQLTGLVAIAKFAMHGREHVVVLRPGKTGIISHTMYFTSEVRADEEYHADTNVVTPKELELAQTLIHSLAAAFEPEKYRDTYREKVESMIGIKFRASRWRRLNSKTGRGRRYRGSLAEESRQFEEARKFRSANSGRYSKREASCHEEVARRRPKVKFRSGESRGTIPILTQRSDSEPRLSPAVCSRTSQNTSE